MNTPVSFETAKLLKEKDWNKPCLNFYFDDGMFSENVFKDITGMDYGSPFQVEFSELIENWNDKYLTKKDGGRCFGCSKSKGYFETFSAPTIAEVVMWLYEKHGIWVLADCGGGETWYSQCNKVGTTGNLKTLHGLNSPTEAYEAAIEYILNNLI